jgi:hypothetical protein
MTVLEAPPRTATRTPSIRPLLHPSETSRLILAVVAAGLTLAFWVLVIVAAHVASVLNLLLAVAGTVTAIAASIWFAQQWRRSRLLGQSVKVTAVSVPDVHSVVEDVKALLRYRRRVDVYVIDKPESPIVTTSYLGTRVVVIDGDLAGGLLDSGERAQLEFLIGRSIGALRAKHLRLTFVIALLHALDLLKFPAPFILPWYRATTYSGDQIGMTCCGDAEAALRATRRLMVGKELASRMSAGEVLPQVALVRRNRLPRFVQLF